MDWVDGSRRWKSTHPAYPRCWSAIDCIWRSSDRCRQSTPNSMHRDTIWRASRYRRSVISTYGSRFVNWREWRCTGTEWSEYGVQIKVSVLIKNTKIACDFQILIVFLASALIFSVLSLQELCCRTIVRRTSVYAIDTLPLPPSVKSTLKSYALTSSQCINTLQHTKKTRCKTPTLSSTRNSCCLS